jgi:hypothetical protein
MTEGSVCGAHAYAQAVGENAGNLRAGLRRGRFPFHDAGQDQGLIGGFERVLAARMAQASARRRSMACSARRSTAMSRLPLA